MTRKEFEAFLLAPPYELDVTRWPNSSSGRVIMWGGQYQVFAVQLAWEVVEEMNQRAKEDQRLEKED